jgi:hypothetical protein
MTSAGEETAREGGISKATFDVLAGGRVRLGSAWLGR